LPEIWLPYGDVQVALDIKAENLFKVLEKEGNALGQEEVREKLDGLELRGRCAILLSDPSSQDFQILIQLIPILESKGIERSDLVLFTRKDSIRNVRRRADELLLKVSETKRSTNSQEAFEGQSSFGTLLSISSTGFDPMFGFSGGPVGFSKLIGSSAIGDAFFSEKPSSPAPGQRTSSAKFIEDLLPDYSDIPSIQFTSHVGSVLNLFVGPLFECHKNASEALRQSNHIRISEKLKGSIVSPGRYVQSTLSIALKALWNSIGSIREKGTLAIIAESSDGLGSEALRLYSLGRLDLKDRIRHEKYVDGMEDILFLKSIQAKYSTLLVSSLPNYYVERHFGFSTARRVGGTLNHIVEKYGPRTKLFVIPHGSEILISAGNSNP